MVIKPAWCQIFTHDCRNEPATGCSGNSRSHKMSLNDILKFVQI